MISKFFYATFSKLFKKTKTKTNFIVELVRFNSDPGLIKHVHDMQFRKPRSTQKVPVRGTGTGLQVQLQS